jgi:hypothetical protein
MAEEKKQIYVLVILRRDGKDIIAMEDTDYDKVFDEYTEITSKWAACVKESIPFALKKPIVTTFDPGLIYEITINPVVETPANRHDNPYAKEMRRKGLANMQNIGQPLGENLDEGYR